MDQLITEVTLIPDGMEWTDINCRAFSIRIVYRGHYVKRGAEDQGEMAWYAVEHGPSSLSRAGNWYFVIQNFQRWQYRFELSEAIEWAQREVNGIRVNGWTWAEWQEINKEKITT